jgi:hypothetical protein
MIQCKDFAPRITERDPSAELPIMNPSLMLLVL